MSSNLLAKWLAHYDPIHRGMTPAGIANGGMTTVGWFFPRIRGGFNLYRGSPAGHDIDYTIPVGAAGAEASEIRNFSWWAHRADSAYAYALKAVSGGGCESAPASRLWPARFDAAGEMQGDPPNSPCDVRFAPLSGGRFQLRWTYSEREQLVAPQAFRIYHDGETGLVDYSIVHAAVSYHFRQLHFEFTSAGFAHDSRIRWAVRASSAQGIEDDNLISVVAVADAVGPPSHPTAFTECGPEL